MILEPLLPLLAKRSAKASRRLQMPISRRDLSIPLSAPRRILKHNVEKYSLFILNWELQRWELLQHVGHLSAPIQGSPLARHTSPILKSDRFCLARGKIGKTLVECWPANSFFLMVVCWNQWYMGNPQITWASCSISGSHHQRKTELISSPI